MFNDNEPVGPEYIFGDMLSDTPIVKGVEWKNRKNWRLLRYKNKKTAIFPIGVPVTPSIPPYKPTFTSTTIPDDVEKRHPVYGKNPDIYSPLNDEKTEGLNIENLVEVEESRLNKIIQDATELSVVVSNVLMDEAASFMMSYDKASAYTETVLRDGLGVNIEVDSSVMVGISHLAKLNVLNMYADKMTTLPSSIRDRFMRIVTKKIAEDCVQDMNRDIKSEKYSSILKNLTARITQDETPLGTSRTGSTRHASKTGQEVEDIHKANDRQASGVRVSRR